MFKITYKLNYKTITKSKISDSDFRYWYFFGDVILENDSDKITISDVTIGDFAICINLVCKELLSDRHVQTFSDFTDEETKIVYTRNDDALHIDFDPYNCRGDNYHMNISMKEFAYGAKIFYSAVEQELTAINPFLAPLFPIW